MQMKTALAFTTGKLVVPTDVVVTSVFYQNSSYDFGGYSQLEGRGAIHPLGASGIPGAAATPGAPGEILEVMSELYEGVSPRLYISLRGDYAGAPPFTSVKVDSHAPLTGWINFSREGTHTRWYIGTPLMLTPPGRSRLYFG